MNPNLLVFLRDGYSTWYLPTLCIAVTPVVSSEAEGVDASVKSEKDVVDEPVPEKVVEAKLTPAPGVTASAYFPKNIGKGKLLAFLKGLRTYTAL